MSYTLSMSINGIGTFAVESFSFGVDIPVSDSGSGSGAGKPTISPLTITKLLDANSPLLYRAALTNTHIAKAVLSLTMAGNTTPDATYSLSDAAVSSVSDSGSGHGGVFPAEQVTLIFRSIEIRVAGNVVVYNAVSPA